jgi:hypothetical protein
LDRSFLVLAVYDYDLKTWDDHRYGYALQMLGDTIRLLVCLLKLSRKFQSH